VRREALGVSSDAARGQTRETGGGRKIKRIQWRKIAQRRDRVRSR